MIGSGRSDSFSIRRNDREQDESESGTDGVDTIELPNQPLKDKDGQLRYDELDNYNKPSRYNDDAISDSSAIVVPRLIPRPEASLDASGWQRKKRLARGELDLTYGRKLQAPSSPPTESSQTEAVGLRSHLSPNWRSGGEQAGASIDADCRANLRRLSDANLNCKPPRSSGGSRPQARALDPDESDRLAARAQVRVEDSRRFGCASATRLKSSLVGARTRATTIKGSFQRGSPLRHTILSFVGLASPSGGRGHRASLDRVGRQNKNRLISETAPRAGVSITAIDRAELGKDANLVSLVAADKFEGSVESNNNSKERHSERIRGHVQVSVSSSQLDNCYSPSSDKQHDPQLASRLQARSMSRKSTTSSLADDDLDRSQARLANSMNRVSNSNSQKKVDKSVQYDPCGVKTVRSTKQATGASSNNYKHCPIIKTTEASNDSSSNSTFIQPNMNQSDSRILQGCEPPRRKKKKPILKLSASTSSNSMSSSKKGSPDTEYFLSVCTPSANQPPDRLENRDNWDRNVEFLLAVIGFAVDLGNVWRFPYICYRNGGGAFLIPYTIMFILGGLPIFYLEMSLGQYFSSGCLTVWRRVCPIAKGIGYAMCVLNFYTGLYYNTIISWAVYFFVESFNGRLPWTSCDNPWNSKDCRTIEQRLALKSNLTLTALNSLDPANQTKPIHYSSPTKDYFEREVLRFHLSSGIDDLGQIRIPLAIYLAIVFICIYFAIWKGVKSTGKAVWITALLPYFVLLPLLARGVFLMGAWAGIKYYLKPQWEKIFFVDVWVEAAKQIYFSLGPGFGTLMALSSYNKFNHNCRRDALIAASVNYFASFISGLVIFAVLGYMATMENVDVSEVATEGPGLVFQVYPEGLATMQLSSMWSVLFFTMVITLGIDSTFGGLESVITGLCDEYPRTLRRHRGIFIGFLIVLIYICSLPTTTYGGNYVIYVLESYGTSLSLLFIVLFETIVVCWVYGTERFCSNLEEMSGKRPGLYWRICWKYISPTILLLIFVAACSQELDKYHILLFEMYIFPSWAPTIGLLMTGSSVCCIPIYAVYYYRTKTSGSFLEVRCRILYLRIAATKAAYICNATFMIN